MAVGRPSSYSTKIEPYLDKIEQYKRDGRTDKKIAELLGIGYSTLIENRRKFPQLAEALKIGRVNLVEDIEKSLFQLAKGGFTSKTVTRKYIEVDGIITGGIEITETVKEHTPLMSAVAFSLKNLASDKWKDKTEHNINNEEMSNAVKKFLKVKNK